MMELTTLRLTIRPIVEEDWEGIQKIWMDFSSSPYVLYDMPHPYEENIVRHQTNRWAEENRKGNEHLFYAVCTTEGMIGFAAFNLREVGHYELGYAFRADAQGKGYARESLAALLGYLKEQGAERISAGTALNNYPSKRLLEALGFTMTGTEQVSFRKDREGNPVIFEGGIFELNLTQIVFAETEESAGMGARVNGAFRKLTDIVVEKGKDELRRGAELLPEAGQLIRKGAGMLPEAGQLIRKGAGILTESGDILKKGTEVLQEQGNRLRAEAVKLMDDMDRRKMWSGCDDIVCAHAPETIIPGCLVLEGGSFRGLYTSGVLDVLMENGINLQTVIGTSAGALNGYNYVAGEIGRSAKINLTYRHDSRFFGARTTAKNKGVVGFNFILDEIEKELPFDHGRFEDPSRRFLATVTNCETGEVMYMEKGKCGDMLKAVQASASMPFVSEMLQVEGVPCLDGGCAVKIPYQWAMEEGYEKILVIRTRPKKVRRNPEGNRFCEITDMVYKSYPQLAEKLKTQSEQYNRACDDLDRLHEEGRVYMVCPSGSIQTGSLEGDMEKLGALYLLGRRDAEYLLPEIKAYLGIEG